MSQSFFVKTVPFSFLVKWQSTIDSLAETFEVPVAMITRVGGSHLEVLVSKKNSEPPFRAGFVVERSKGLFCQTVINSGKSLYVPDARKDAVWANSSAVEMGLVSYLGTPLIWPDGTVFGSICIIDDKPREFSDAIQRLLEQFKELIEGDFRIIHFSRELFRRRSELEEQKELAEEASRVKSNFIANISHELRTPLNAVIGLLHLVQNTELTPKQENYLSKMDISANSLLGVINNVLDISKLEVGGVCLDNEPFDLLATVNHLVFSFKTATSSKCIELKVDIDPTLPNLFMGDKRRLQQVLNNLIGNAVKFTEKGRVTLSIQEEDAGRVGFMVSDSGIGMSAEQIAGIFDSFHQVDGSTTRKFGGAGLGLTISKRLIELMGGRIKVESEIGKGSVFSFSIKLETLSS